MKADDNKPCESDMYVLVNSMVGVKHHGGRKSVCIEKMAAITGVMAWRKHQWRNENIGEDDKMYREMAMSHVVGNNGEIWQQ